MAQMTEATLMQMLRAAAPESLDYTEAAVAEQRKRRSLVKIGSMVSLSLLATGVVLITRARNRA